MYNILDYRKLFEQYENKEFILALRYALYPILYSKIFNLDCHFTPYVGSFSRRKIFNKLLFYISRVQNTISRKKPYFIGTVIPLLLNILV